MEEILNHWYFFSPFMANPWYPWKSSSINPRLTHVDPRKAAIEGKHSPNPFAIPVTARPEVIIIHPYIYIYIHTYIT